MPKTTEIIFPCFRYHKDHEARIFRSADELKAAGKGWVDTPAKLVDGYKKPVDDKPDDKSTEDQNTGDDTPPDGDSTENTGDSTGDDEKYDVPPDGDSDSKESATDPAPVVNGLDQMGRDELVEFATTRKIDFHPNLGTEKLRARISEKCAERRGETEQSDKE